MAPHAAVTSTTSLTGSISITGLIVARQLRIDRCIPARGRSVSVRAESARERERAAALRYARS